MRTFIAFLLLTFSSINCAQDPYYVGDLGDAWEFPSDHLTIGATLDDFHIAFWNVLNKEYLGHIEENTQGLRDTSILRDNVPAPGHKPLTLRELTVCQDVLEMILHPTHPRSLIGLQETHPDVQKFLQTNLPPQYKILTPPGQPLSQDLFIYDTDRFDFISKDSVRYTEGKPKTIFTITLFDKTQGKTFRFIQSHVPGGPNSPEGCAKFAAEVSRQFDPAITTVLMGDMNQSPAVITNALEAADVQSFHYLPNAYPTHMNTHKQASWIDLFFVYNADAQSSDDPAELFNGLVPTVEHLQSMREVRVEQQMAIHDMFEPDGWNEYDPFPSYKKEAI